VYNNVTKTIEWPLFQDEIIPQVQIKMAILDEFALPEKTRIKLVGSNGHSMIINSYMPAGEYNLIIISP
jgi:hypothetical protein